MQNNIYFTSINSLTVVSLSSAVKCLEIFRL